MIIFGHVFFATSKLASLAGGLYTCACLLFYHSTVHLFEDSYILQSILCTQNVNASILTFHHMLRPVLFKTSEFWSFFLTFPYLVTKSKSNSNRFGFSLKVERSYLTCLVNFELFKIDLL